MEKMIECSVDWEELDVSSDWKQEVESFLLHSLAQQIYSSSVWDIFEDFEVLGSNPRM